MEPEIPDGATPEATPAHFDWLSQGQVSAVADAVAPFKLPPIDVGPLRGGFLKSILVSSKAKEEAALALVASLKQHGFAVITNHGIDSTEIMAQTRALFKLSQRDKKDLAQKPQPSEYLLARAPSPTRQPARPPSPTPELAPPRPPSPTRQPVRPPSPTSAMVPPRRPEIMMKTARGYSAPRMEALNPAIGPDMKETFDFGLAFDKEGNTHLGTNPWPTRALSTLEPVAMAYLKHGCDLAHHILRAVALGLGLDEHAFDEHFNKPLAVQRLIRYPPQGDEQTSMGAGSHVDYGAITLLHQSAPGLEIQVDGQWRIVDAPPDALIVNTGFMLEKLTGGVLVATQHRVINRNPADRYSTALFLDPHPTAQIAPIACGAPVSPNKKYEACVAGHKGVRYHGSGYSVKKIAPD